MDVLWDLTKSGFMGWTIVTSRRRRHGKYWFQSQEESPHFFFFSGDEMYAEWLDTIMQCNSMENISEWIDTKWYNEIAYYHIYWNHGWLRLMYRDMNMYIYIYIHAISMNQGQVSSTKRRPTTQVDHSFIISNLDSILLGGKQSMVILVTCGIPRPIHKRCGKFLSTVSADIMI